MSLGSYMQLESVHLRLEVFPPQRPRLLRHQHHQHQHLCKMKRRKRRQRIPPLLHPLPLPRRQLHLRPRLCRPGLPCRPELNLPTPTRRRRMTTIGTTLHPHLLLNRSDRSPSNRRTTKSRLSLPLHLLHHLLLRHLRRLIRLVQRLVCELN